MRLRSTSKIWTSVVVCLVIMQALASSLLPNSYTLTAITDFISLSLILSAAFAFWRNALHSTGRLRLVWILLGAGYAVEGSGQVLGMYWELVVRKVPAMSLGDATVFLAWALLILGLALRPHVDAAPVHERLGTLDLLLILMAGIYLYLFLVIPWQYLAPEPQSYGPAYKFLALSQDVTLLCIVLLGWRHSSGYWRRFFAVLSVTVALDAVMEYFVDTLSDAGVYVSGSWYDSTTAACLAGMTVAALIGFRLEPGSEDSDPETEHYWYWASRLAAPVTLVLPLIAAWSFMDHNLPVSVWKFRVLLSLGAVVVFGFVGIVKQVRLEKELAHANRDLLDASITDLLTGVRNRRFFSNSIEADVQQVLRSFVGNQSSDPRNRDLVFYLIDIDHFKRVNDQFGHKVGDHVLVEVARRINSAARLSDAVIRWGGEEFLLLSRYTDRKEAHILASRVLEAVGSKPYKVDGGNSDLQICCSIGWAAFPWKGAEPTLVSHDQVLVLADFALYQAKGMGRNQAVGLLPDGETVRGGTVAPTIYINGIPTSSVITPGPQLAESLDPDPPKIPSKSTAASASS